MKLAVSYTWQIQISTLFLFTHIFVALIQPQGILQTPLIFTLLFVICGFVAYLFTYNHHEYTEEK
jgi:Ca2+/Na+ antiporter